MSSVAVTSVSHASSSHTTGTARRSRCLEAFLRVVDSMPNHSYAAWPTSSDQFQFVHKRNNALYVTYNNKTDTMTRESAIKAFADTHRHIQCISRLRDDRTSKKNKHRELFENVNDDEPVSEEY